MGNTIDEIVRKVVKKVGEVIDCYEKEMSIRKIKDADIMFIPKSYFLSKVASIELEEVWWRLPQHYQNDFDFICSRPCILHYNIKELTFSTLSNVPRKRECLLCKYDRL